MGIRRSNFCKSDSTAGNSAGSGSRLSLAPICSEPSAHEPRMVAALLLLAIALDGPDAMPKKPKHLRRSGDNARGAAALNQWDAEFPNTNTSEWCESYQGKVDAQSLLAPLTVAPNGAPKRERAAPGEGCLGRVEKHRHRASGVRTK